MYDITLQTSRYVTLLIYERAEYLARIAAARYKENQAGNEIATK
jgi:hypothetical protein